MPDFTPIVMLRPAGVWPAFRAQSPHFSGKTFSFSILFGLHSAAGDHHQMGFVGLGFARRSNAIRLYSSREFLAKKTGNYDDVVQRVLFAFGCRRILIGKHILIIPRTDPISTNPISSGQNRVFPMRISGRIEHLCSVTFKN